MARVTAHGETITVRLEPDLKADLTRMARAQSLSVGEVVRVLIRDSVEQRKRSEFLAEARRQSLELARAAEDPNSDEAAILRELGAAFEDFAGGKEWR